MWLYVAGILKPDVLSPDVDSSVLVGYPFAERSYGFDGHPTTIFVKATDSRVTAVDNLLGAQTDPEDPGSPDVSVPSAALVAQADAKGAFNTLFLGLGAVALALIGGAAGVAATAVYAHAKGWAVVIPAQAWAGGLASAVLIGALAGLLPALKAARLSPTEALWTL